MGYNEKVKALLDKVHASIEDFSPEQLENDYISSLIDAQERGEIKHLRFSASERGLVASFSVDKTKNRVKISVA
jgi:hypothetical protein